MSDKNRLSSEQALDDYFFDLLIEPEEVLEPAPTVESDASESEIETVEPQEGVPETQERDSALDAKSTDELPAQLSDTDELAGQTTEASLAEIDKVDGLITNCDQKSEDNSKTVDSLDEFVDVLALEMSSSSSTHYDFSTIELTQSADESEDDQVVNTHHDDEEVLATQSRLSDSALEQSEVNSEINDDLVSPSLVSSFSLTQHSQSQASNWAPSAQRVEVSKGTSFTPLVMEHNQPDMQGVQRLLDQMANMQTAIQQDSDALIDSITEAEFLAAAQEEVMLA
ncbi:hypothetical protein ACED51_14795, partial [Photobacterium swingsii]|uniref:hypothetical protein n=1 Tax=Photobacterium swingsii TaxID=680026 RepID=UPI00352CE8F0